MDIALEIWLRSDNHATSHVISPVEREPKAWTDEDVRGVLEGMLRAMDRLKHPGETERGVALRALSWIVNPFQDGGVVIAIEITLGAAIAGPFDIEQGALETMIERVLARPSSTSVH